MTPPKAWAPRTVQGLHVAPSMDGWIVYDPSGGVVHELNATAHFVLCRCDGSATVLDIGVAYLEAFGCDAVTSARDTRQVLADLMQAGLLEGQNP